MLVYLRDGSARTSLHVVTLRQEHTHTHTHTHKHTHTHAHAQCMDILVHKQTPKKNTSAQRQKVPSAPTCPVWDHNPILEQRRGGP